MKTANLQRGTERYNHVLNDGAVRQILADVERRKQLLAEAKRLSDKALAVKWGVHPRTIWKVSARASWIHVHNDQAVRRGCAASETSAELER